MTDETTRLLYERCLHFAKKEQGDTGFIARQEKIAIYDNFLFCLLLFRSKTHENVLEAKKLLEQLLYFQNLFEHLPSVGNYPLLVSDYPYCTDHFQAIRCLIVKTVILREFALVLGHDLNERLQTSIQKSKNFLTKILPEVKFPLWARCQLASLGIVDTLGDLSDHSDLRTWGDPQCLAELIVAYQLAPSSGWKPFWHYLSQTWHKPSGQFAGPAYKCGHIHPHFSCCLGLFSQKLETYPLFGALLTNRHELEEVALPAALEGQSDRFTWSVRQEEAFAYSTLVGKARPEEMPGLFPYYLVTSHHCLAIQAPFGYSSSALTFELYPELFAEEKEKAKALIISFNDHPENRVLVAGQMATCFELKDPLQIRLGTMSLNLGFTRLSGDGEFVGHIIRGNRSGHANERYKATDVQIFLRALRGTTPTTLRVELTF